MAIQWIFAWIMSRLGDVFSPFPDLPLGGLGFIRRGKGPSLLPAI